MAPNIEKELQQLEVELRQLEAEYNMFFSGRLPKPPWETRSRVEAMVKRFLNIAARDGPAMDGGSGAAGTHPENDGEGL